MNECVCEVAGLGDGDPSVTNLEMQPEPRGAPGTGRGHNGLQLQSRVTGHSGETQTQAALK